MSRIRKLTAAAAVAAAVSLPLAGTAIAQTDPYDCSDFTTQQEAQQQFESTDGDPSGLDADGDGKACESLDDGAAPTSEPEPTTTQPQSEPTTPAPKDEQQEAPADEFVDKDCADLTHAEAIALLAEDPSDPHRLDRDGDGLPCESKAGDSDDAKVADEADEDGTAPAPQPQEAHIAVTG